MGTSLRVVSLNLWNGRGDPDALEVLLRRLDPDVVGVQELGPDQAEVIGAVLPHGQLAPATDYTGMGIALRHQAVFERVPMSYRDLWKARLEPGLWPGLPASLEVGTVHIAAPHVWPYGIGFWHRRRQVRELEAYFEANPEERRVLVGDFNATPLWPVYRRIASQLTDAAVAVARVRGRPTAATWGPRPWTPRMLRIDHGFVRGVRAEEFQVVDGAGSDHSAIVIDLSFEGIASPG